ncbi:hypothetical protein BGZ51_003498 [Haplosporangium sp. Z 767]|nr:hypothetical protein BGZ51_003498 [Haplosporangium sp. Z 767]
MSTTLTATAVPTATASPDSSIITGDTGDSDSNSIEFQSGGFIYVILLIGLLTGVIYFTRVCIAKRRERIRAMKDPDFDGPPTYHHHLDDLQVIDARPRETSPSGQLVIPTAPASALIRGENYYIVTPRTHSRTGSSASASSNRSRSATTTARVAGAGAGADVSLAFGSEEPLPPPYEELSPRETTVPPPSAPPPSPSSV